MNMRNVILENIAESGHHLMGVMAEEKNGVISPSFVYTIGLTARYGIELIVLGMRPDHAATMMNDIADKLVACDFELNIRDDRFANMPIIARECNDKVRNYVIQADHFYGRPVRVAQIVLPDREGRFPEEDAYESEYMSTFQPLLYSI